MALIWSAWAVAHRAFGLKRRPRSIRHPIGQVDDVEPPQFADTEATWWSV